MPDSLYDRDFVIWSETQAERLRRLAAGERVNDVDWDNLIEEVETLGRSEIQAVESLLEQALLHAMKVAARPDDPASSHWRGEIRTFLNNARRRHTPSMRQRIAIPDIYADALDAVRQMRLGGPQRPLRDTTNLTLADLLSRDLDTDDLIAAVSAPTP